MKVKELLELLSNMNPNADVATETILYGESTVSQVVGASDGFYITKSNDNRDVGTIVDVDDLQVLKDEDLDGELEYKHVAVVFSMFLTPEEYENHAHK